MSNSRDLNSPSSWNMRIWDEAKHQWLCDGEDDVLPYYGFDIRGGEVTAFQGIDWIYKQHERWNDFIWERSTGLTDKNGKEIYEGDILLIPARKDKSKGYLYTVLWHKVHARFNFANKNGEFGEINIGKIKRAEVIGNIHEKDEPVDFDHVKGGEE